MEMEKLIKAIEKEYSKSIDVFFEYAWREKIDEFLNADTKYAKLVDWINERIETHRNTIDIFNPADRTEQYTNGFFELYRKACEEIAMLINFKIIILDKRCSMQMRENVEYAICKIFNVYYNKELDSYISKLGEENV